MEHIRPAKDSSFTLIALLFFQAIPDVDTGNNLLVDKRLLKLVRQLVAPLDWELLDLGQLARERLVLSTAWSAMKKIMIWEMLCCRLYRNTLF